MSSPPSPDHSAAIKRFFEVNNLTPHAVAKRGSFAVGLLYNLFANKTHTLKAETLRKIAQVTGASIEDILEGRPISRHIRVAYSIGVLGKMFELPEPFDIVPPTGIPLPEELDAAVIRGAGLHPLPDGWVVYFRRNAPPIEECIGKLCIVWPVATDQPMVREVMRGQTPGLYNLTAWMVPPLLDVELAKACPVVAITQPG